MRNIAGRSLAGFASLVGVVGGLLTFVSCSAPGVPGPGASPGRGSSAIGSPAVPLGEKDEAYRRLVDRLDEFKVAGVVRTVDGLLLPEHIEISIQSQVCVESRRPGTRFWSLEYDTCFVYADLDTVDASGNYSLRVPCTDADRTYESHHDFGDLRLVQRGPVSFVAVSDAGWKHQETFSTSRLQRRDLELTLDPETFFVIETEVPMRGRADPGADVIRNLEFGTSVDVIRFLRGWAEVRCARRIGWVKMHYLGSRAEMERAAPLKRKSAAKPLRSGS